MNTNPNAHWRDSARLVQFFVVDYRAMFPVLILIFIPRLWTAVLAVGSILFFMILERYGYTVTVFFRILRGWLSGPYKVARPWWYRPRG